VKIVIDENACTGHARCVALAPQLFTDDDRGYGMVIGDGTIPADLVAVAERAVNGCPERAISIIV
jgi:ferredoxin